MSTNDAAESPAFDIAKNCRRYFWRQKPISAKEAAADNVFVVDVRQVSIISHDWKWTHQFKCSTRFAVGSARAIYIWSVESYSDTRTNAPTDDTSWWRTNRVFTSSLSRASAAAAAAAAATASPRGFCVTLRPWKSLDSTRPRLIDDGSASLERGADRRVRFAQPTTQLPSPRLCLPPVAARSTQLPRVGGSDGLLDR